MRLHAPGKYGSSARSQISLYFEFDGENAIKSRQNVLKISSQGNGDVFRGISEDSEGLVVSVTDSSEMPWKGRLA